MLKCVSAYPMSIVGHDMYALLPGKVGFRKPGTWFHASSQMLRTFCNSDSMYHCQRGYTVCNLCSLKSTVASHWPSSHVLSSFYVLALGRKWRWTHHSVILASASGGEGSILLSWCLLGRSVMWVHWNPQIVILFFRVVSWSWSASGYFGESRRASVILSWGILWWL